MFTLPLHGSYRVISDRLRFLLFLFFSPLSCALIHVLDKAPVLRIWIEHFEGSAAGIDLVVMAKIGETFEDTEQLLVPCAAPDLHIPGPTLRAERPEAG